MARNLYIGDSNCNVYTFMALAKTIDGKWKYGSGDDNGVQLWKHKPIGKTSYGNYSLTCNGGYVIYKGLFLEKKKSLYLNY